MRENQTRSEKLVAIEPVILDQNGETLYQPDSPHSHKSEASSGATLTSWEEDTEETHSSRTDNRYHRRAYSIQVTPTSGWLSRVLVVTGLLLTPVLVMAGLIFTAAFVAGLLILWIVRVLISSLFIHRTPS